MTTTNKILAVSALAAVAAYFLLKPEKTGGSIVAKCGANEAPCSNGNGCYSILARYSSDPCATVKKILTKPPVKPFQVGAAEKVNYVNTKENHFFQPTQVGFSVN